MNFKFTPVADKAADLEKLFYTIETHSLQLVFDVKQHGILKKITSARKKYTEFEKSCSLYD